MISQMGGNIPQPLALQVNPVNNLKLLHDPWEGKA
jgi:hypothetical protein